ncbi:MAG: NAD(P)-binding protein, partial [Pseudomonadota bacterium]
MPTQGRPTLPDQIDVAVIGAGFAGMYLLKLLRDAGFSAVAIEKGAGVGGTWYWNRYPGARCDIESVQYAHGYLSDLQDDWDWSERYATQGELLTYANEIADRLDARGAGADDRDPLAGEIDARVRPGAGLVDRLAECVPPGKVDRVGHRQAAGGHDEEVRPRRLAGV